MFVAVDSNVLGYAEGLDDVERRDRASQVLQSIDGDDLVMPLQVACELHRLVARRRRLDAGQAALIVRRWLALITRNPPTLRSTMDTALDLAAERHLQVFDAVIMAAASEAGCRVLLSEDLQDGFVWRGLTVVNPFAAQPHPLLADLLRS